MAYIKEEKSIDARLIHRLNEGDREAFRVIYDLRHANVYRFALALTKRFDQSEEVVQETFLRLWVHHAEIDATKSLDAFLFTVARRLVIDMLRQATSTAALRDGMWHAMQKEDDATEQAILEAELTGLFNSMVAQLPAKQQLIFKMSRELGLTHEQIAAKLGISKNTVKNHVVSALKTLKGKLAKHGFFFLLFFLYFFC